MCEVRVITYKHPTEVKERGFRIDLAGYQSQIKTVSTPISINSALAEAEEWSKMTGWNVVTYEEEEVVETRLTKVPVALEGSE